MEGCVARGVSLDGRQLVGQSDEASAFELGLVKAAGMAIQRGVEQHGRVRLERRTRLGTHDRLVAVDELGLGGADGAGRQVEDDGE